MRFIYHLHVTVILLILYSCGSDATENTENKTLFTLMPQSETGIEFINRVEDREFFNILTYRNFYNGAGISIGDINNDGLPDLFFTSNMGKNKLYLNKGDFRFEDVSEKAGIGGTKAWSTGATMVDINNDGWLDIYVCNSGDVKGDDKENELFINNKDLTFTESGALYNLNNTGFSTHASFFDYDLDGDLDCYILNNSFIETSSIELYRVARNSVDNLGGDKLYRNDGGVFVDVTEEAGIYSSEIGFGLGVSVSDLNNDQLPDIYISNDFWERDYLYINKGDGTFSEELTQRLSICSVSSMGADIGDINNDGNPEIFTTDMLAGDNYRLKAMTIFDPYHLEDMKYRANYHYQILQNCLHVNNGNLNFQEIANLAGVASSDWSWGALMFDFENDGYKDIFVSNGIARDILYLDFVDFIADKDNVKKVVEEQGKFDWRDFLPYLPSNPIKNSAFVNKGGFKFENLADDLGLGKPSFSNGAAYGDLDNDGDLDLVINNVNMPAFVYRNESEKVSGNNFIKIKFQGPERNLFGIGAQVKIYDGNQQQVQQSFPSRGFQSSTEPYLIFGLGHTKVIDKMEVIWPDKKKQIMTNIRANQELVVRYSDAASAEKVASLEVETMFDEITSNLALDKAIHQENVYNDFNHEQLLLRMFSTEGPRVLVGDIDGNDLDDFVLLGARNDSDKIFRQRENGTFELLNVSVINQDSSYESTCGALVDLNNDGDLDLIIGSGGNEYHDIEHFSLRIYLNDGKGNFIREVKERIPPIIGNFSCIAAHDFDSDGYVDLFIGGRLVPGNYGVIPKSFLLKNIQGNLIDVTPNNLGGVGMVTDAVWTDFDGDNDKDLMIVGEWMPINFIINENGQFKKRKVVPNSSGWWNRIETADLDQDGDEDYVLGNWGTNTKFKASAERPLTMFVKDFDNNRKTEFIINWYPPLNDEPYPFATKAEITQQIPVLKKSNLKYEDYAHKTYEELFPEKVRENALSYKAEILESVILWNSNDELDIEILPVEAQVTPIFGLVVRDFDKDGFNDMWLGGNFYGLKPQVGRHNSSQGVYLRGLGNREFEYIKPREVGIYVEGEVRDAQVMEVNGKELLMIARNNDAIICFETR